MRTITKFAVALVAVAVCAGGAWATPITPNSTFGFVPIGNTSYTPTTPSDLFSATSITIPALEFVNSVPCTYLTFANTFGNAADSCAGLTPVPSGTILSFNSNTLDLTFTSLPTITWTASGGDVMTFVASSGVETKSNNGAENVLVYYLGTFSDGNNVYLSSTASVSFAFTQTGGNTGTVNFSGTFADPPLPTVPEPTTLVLLGSVFLGLGFARRRKA